MNETVYYWKGFPSTGQWKEVATYLLPKDSSKHDTLVIALSMMGYVAVIGTKTAGPPITPPTIRQFRLAGVLQKWQEESEVS